MLPSVIDFEGVALTIIDREGRPWLTQGDLARALYGIKGEDTLAPPFANAMRSLRRLFDRNNDEFTDEMTAMLTMETAGGPQQVRIFSTRGAYLMGMFSKTDRAKRFRHWILDVLEGKASLERPAPLSLAERRVRVMELNAANRTMDHIVKTSGRRAAFANLTEVYAKAGLRIDLSKAAIQGDLL
ncbi:BRO-N domain-containing protein [Azospirillum brasilense]|uniref:BRO-N domain-containing protein n=1 Tax=Azospirillum brasilense TaxID=192 RepID=UPI000E67E3DC|nr:Bro-N domain-containing protein [Azospirillum brasilense]NUB24313.1 transcriptional regulator [Azospirillum brasilense]NUB34115.1 transcriptional regulator [Azospirillum brasilense]RIW00996.1 transcriptional regulator [Azospirillum brasilense]